MNMDEYVRVCLWGEDPIATLKRKFIRVWCVESRLISESALSMEENLSCVFVQYLIGARLQVHSSFLDKFVIL